jgi:hypothetical protein
MEIQEEFQVQLDLVVRLDDGRRSGCNARVVYRVSWLERLRRGGGGEEEGVFCG